MPGRSEGSPDGGGSPEGVTALHSGNGPGHGGGASAGVEQVAQMFAKKIRSLNQNQEISSICDVKF